MIETRDRIGRIRAASVRGTPGVTLHAISPGAVDSYGSLWMADTFDESLANRLPTLCWSHLWDEPLGPAVGYRTSSNGPDIDFIFSHFDAVPTARRAYAQVKDGTISDCSVGFSDAQRRDPTDAEVARYPGIREVILKATLDEVSLVLRGAVVGAVVAGVRRRGELTRRIDKASKTLTPAEVKELDDLANYARARGAGTHARRLSVPTRSSRTPVSPRIDDQVIAWARREHAAGRRVTDAQVRRYRWKLIYGGT